jgi:hypothetical protein
VTEPLASRNGGAAARRVTLAAAVAVLLLAAGAALWPRGDAAPESQGLLVLDPAGRSERATGTWPALAAFLADDGEAAPPVRIARTREEFREGLSGRPAWILCPDGLALGLDPQQWTPLAAGRRAAPRNLRPRSVLVYRKSAGLQAAPWRDAPAATVAGDSFSLAATGAWRGGGGAGPGSGCAWGPDPYDHAPALHAARLGCFDYALVRQWDAEEFFTAGLLDPLEWGMEPVTGMVLLASTAGSRSRRLAAAEGLAALGRADDEESPVESRLRRALDAVGLAGFNLVMEPDFDQVRRGFGPDWLPGRD